MEYFKKSIDFLVKNFLIIVPIYVAVVVPLFFAGSIFNLTMSQFMPMFQSMMSDGVIPDTTEMVQTMMSNLSSVMANSALASFFGLVLSLIAYPAALGLIKKGLAGEETGLQFFVDALKENFVQYLLFLIGCIIVGVIAGIGLTIVFLILGLITAAIGTFGSILLVLISIAAVVFGIYFGIRLFSLWLPAMIIDKAGIFEGLKKGFETTKGSFWLLFLVTLLVSIATGILSAILGFLAGIVIIGPLVLGAISALSSFLLYVFFMIVYKEKSQGSTEPATDA